MKVNKYIIIGSILIGVICIFLMIAFEHTSLLGSIAISLLTGTIISVLASAIYYLNERQKILCAIKDAIPAIYINLKYMNDMMSDILPKVIYVQYLNSMEEAFQRIH